MKLKIENSKISGNALIAILLFVDLVVVTSLDIFVPALPEIRDEFMVSEAYLNLTIFSFMVFGALAVLVAAPLADRLGRKPVMFFSVGSFCIGSLICTTCPNVEILIVGRILQSFGLGGVEALTTTIVTEAFHQDSLKLAMTLVQSLVLFGPFLAPFFGTFTLSLASWRLIFVVCLLFGIISFILIFLIPETKPASMVKVSSKGSLGRLLRDWKFVAITLILGISALPAYGFIGVFPYICMDYFQGSYSEYSVLYAVAMLVSILAPFLYERVSKKVSHYWIYIFCIALLFVSFITMPIFGFINVVIFTLTFLPSEVTDAIIRPMSYIVLLEQPEQDVATASSLSNFTYTFISGFGSVIATLPIFENNIQAMCVICGFTGIVCALLFFSVRKYKI